jgi:GxxExxY protein
MTKSPIEQFASTVLNCAFRVHTALGPGLLESSYKACLAYEVTQSGLRVQVEVPVPLIYAGQKMADVGYRVDVLVEDELIVEIKSVDAIVPVHKAQLLSYLRLSNKRLGLLINFNEVHLKEGIRRVANNL